MRVALDLDSTVADLSSDWYGAINKDHEKTHGKLEIQNVKGWGIHEYHPIGKEVYKYLSIPGLFKNLKPFKSAIEVLQYGFESEGDEHFILTDAVTDGAVSEKREWVHDQMPWVKDENIYVLSKASTVKKVDIAKKIKAHVVVDDAPHHVTDFASVPDLGIACIGYEYNLNVANLCDFYVHAKLHKYNFNTAWEMIEVYLNQRRMELNY